MDRRDFEYPVCMTKLAEKAKLKRKNVLICICRETNDRSHSLRISHEHFLVPPLFLTKVIPARNSHCRVNKQSERRAGGGRGVQPTTRPLPSSGRKPKALACVSRAASIHWQLYTNTLSNRTMGGTRVRLSVSRDGRSCDSRQPACHRPCRLRQRCVMGSASTDTFSGFSRISEAASN